MNSKQTKGQPEIPRQLFETFLHKLETADIPLGVVERLRRTIIREMNLSDKAIKAALFPEDESSD